MTTYEAKINEINVISRKRVSGNGVNNNFDNNLGAPIRFIPVEVISETSSRSQWHGSHGIIYRTKTGKMVAILTNWSLVDGEIDERRAYVASTEAEIFEVLGNSGYKEAQNLRCELAEKFEVVPTI
jgi:hypothetical protein